MKEIGGWNIGLARNPEPPEAKETHDCDAELVECDNCYRHFWTDDTSGFISCDLVTLCSRCVDELREP